MKSIAVFGGTGLVGSQLIDYLVKSGFSIMSYQRKKTISKHRVSQVITPIEEIENYNYDGDTVIICLGSTIAKAGSNEAFMHIDHDLIRNIGIWAKKQGVKKLHVISSIGASSSAKGLYLETKYRMEQSLQSLNFESLYIYRPSLYADVNRRPIRIKEFISVPVLNLIGSLSNKFSKYRPIKSITLVKQIVANIAREKKGVIILESDEIQMAASLSVKQYLNKEQSLLTSMFSVLSILWIILEIIGLGYSGVRIILLTILFALLVLWGKSKFILKRGISKNETKEYYSKLRSFKFMRALLWIELLGFISSIILFSFPFMSITFILLLFDVKVYYSIQDYLNGFNNVIREM